MFPVPAPGRRALLALALSLVPLCASAQVRISEVQGEVEVRQSSDWLRVTHLPTTVTEGGMIRTSHSSAAMLDFPDGSTIKLGPSATFTVQTLTKSRFEFLLNLGSLHAWVKKGLARKFAVRTPNAVAAVRGTEFLVDVGQHATEVDVVEGVVAVKTVLGEEVELGDGRQLRSIRVLPDRPLDLPAPDGTRQRHGLRTSPNAERSVMAASHDEDLFKKDVQREVALGVSKDEVQAAAAVEARRAVYEEGKTMIDSSGERVRLEEYITRPAADTMKFVVLNSRADSLNYFYYQAQFNQALPPVLAPALTYLNGKTGTAPDYFITAYETGRSNTIDKIQEIGTGGHLVNTPLTADTVVYDGGANSFSTVKAGTAFWSTLFNNYSYAIDGREKFGWQPAAGVVNVTQYDYGAGGFNTRILGGGPLSGNGTVFAGGVTCTSTTCENANRPAQISQPQGNNVLTDRAKISYADGTYEQYDFQVIGDDGKSATAADFGNVTTGTTYKNTLLKWNFEQVITASEFQGRKIDLVVEPKILVNSGIIQ